jgi:MFS family permease
MFATLSVVITFLYIDKFGRKPLLIIGTLLILLSFALLLVFRLLDINSLILNIITMILYFIGFSISGASTCMVYIYEILPNEIRRSGCSLVQTLSWTFNLIMVVVLPHLYSDNKWIIFIIMTATTMLAIIITIKLLPETKRMTLEEIGEFWSVRENKKKNYQ